MADETIVTIISLFLVLAFVLNGVHSVSYASSLDSILSAPYKLVSGAYDNGGANGVLLAIIVLALIVYFCSGYVFDSIGVSGILYILVFLMLYGLVI